MKAGDAVTGVVASIAAKLSAPAVSLRMGSPRNHQTDALGANGFTRQGFRRLCNDQGSEKNSSSSVISRLVQQQGTSAGAQPRHLVKSTRMTALPTDIGK